MVRPRASLFPARLKAFDLQPRRPGAGGGGGLLGSRVALLSAPAFTAGLGKGLKEPVSPFRTANVFGADLSAPNADNWNAAPQIVNPAAAFDLSTLTPNHEVVVALTVLTNLTQGGILEILWSRTVDYAILYDYLYSIPNPADYGYASWSWFYVYSYIGYDAWEINQNGGYRADIWWDQSYDTLLTSLPFTVTGIPALSPAISGLGIVSITKP